MVTNCIFNIGRIGGHHGGGGQKTALTFHTRQFFAVHTLDKAPTTRYGAARAPLLRTAVSRYADDRPF